MRLLLLVSLSLGVVVAQDQPAPAAAAAPAQAPAAAPAAAPATAPAPSPDQAAPAAASDSPISGSVELGYRFVSGVGGSQDVYNSTVNLGQGLRLVNLDFTVSPVKALWDHFEVQASAWGDPYNTARLEVSKNGLYRFTADYRNTAYFNFLPSYANPEVSSGSLLTESSFDTHIRTSDVQLDLLPGHWISPYLAWSRDSWYGSGVTDFVLFPNNYPVANSESDSTDNFRGGVQLQLPLVHLVLEAGGTTFKDDQGATDTQPNNGDLTLPYFGQQLNLSALDELYRVRGDSLYTKALLASNPLPWLSISGNFMYADPSLTTNYASSANGTLFLPATFAFYSSGQDMATADANMPHSSGSLNVEARPLKRLRIVEYWSTDRLHNAASSLLTEQYLSTGSPFLNTDIGADRLVLTDNEQQIEAFYDVLPSLTVRGGERYEWGDATVRGSTLSELPLESSSLSRNSGLAGVTFRLKQKLRTSADFEAASNGEEYFRTSLRNYWKLRTRAQWEFLPDWRLAGDFFELNNNNPDPLVNLRFVSRATSASLSWLPKGGHNVSMLLEYTRSNVNSNILYLDPGTLGTALSTYLENGNTAMALIDLAPKAMHGFAPRFSFGGSLFTSAGSQPIEYYQPTARLSVPLAKGVQWNSEWRWYSLAERLYSFEDFRSNQLMVSLKYTR
jgi:hypothetical protein